MNLEQTKNIYSCPMHPEVISGEPGKCPKCGMDLVLKAPVAEARPKEIDPVCKMKVDPETAKNVLELNGKTYYFCGKGCLEKFKSDPEKYLNPSSAPIPIANGNDNEPLAQPKRVSRPVVSRQASKPVPTSTKTGYFCPMDPEVFSDHPGDCPKCGMALEPITPTLANAEENSELKAMTRRFGVSAVLTLPLIVPMLGELTHSF